MAKGFMMKLEEIQPSQSYISSAKLSEVAKKPDSTTPGLGEPVLVKKLGNDVVLVDGHTRAFAAFLSGLSEVLVSWEDEELDWDEYEICVQWCKEEGIRTIADLKSRVVSREDYEKLWYRRCDELHRNLAESRRKQARKTVG